MKVPRGKRVFEAGDKIQYAYILLQGSIKLSQMLLSQTTYKYEKITISTYEDGALFGEYALLARANQTAEKAQLISSLKDTKIKMTDSVDLGMRDLSHLEIKDPTERLQTAESTQTCHILKIPIDHFHQTLIAVIESELREKISLLRNMPLFFGFPIYL
jgi:CRP-like cAMP-binding protein